MYLIVIVWTYVTLMMAVAEATSPVGSVLGAIVTFMLYGALPMSILVYILGTPSRKRKIKAREAAEQAAYDNAKQATAKAPVERGEVQCEVNSDGDGNVNRANPQATNASVAPDAGSESPTAAQGATVAPVRKEP